MNEQKLIEAGKTMSESYEGYGWIKVKRAKPVEIDGIKYVTEEHHIEETNFLINEVRKLAKELLCKKE